MTWKNHFSLKVDKKEKCIGCGKEYMLRANHQIHAYCPNCLKQFGISYKWWNNPKLNPFNITEDGLKA